MNKKEYFLMAMKKELFGNRTWCLRAMGLPTNLREIKEDYHLNSDGLTWYFFNDEGEKVNITGVDAKKPFIQRKNDKLTLEAGDLPNVTEKIETAYTQALINMILFVWPFKEPLPYVQGRFNGKAVDKIIADRAEKKTISVEEYRRNFVRACGYLTTFTQLAVTAATEKSISPSKEALKERDRLLKKHADELDDPAVLALIDQRVAAVDREYLKGDDSEQFFLKGKQIDTVRKKLFHIQGGVPRLDDPSRMEIMPNSLDEGMTPENMPAAVNNLRSGSYGRAKDTALGGEAAKFATRAYQNVRISSEDCGTKIGEQIFIESDHVGKLSGMYLVGDDQPLDEKRIKSLIGKSVYLRVPAACKENNRNYCVRCIGHRIADSGIGVGPLMNQIGNVFMSVSLAAFHGSSLKTTLLKKNVGFKKILRIR